jgi:flotillin
VKEVQTQAEIAVEEQAILREQKKQEWTQVVPAEAAATAAIKKSEGTKQAEINVADGEATARKARATANQAELEAQAAGDAAKVEKVGLAQAKITEQIGLAQAKATEANLLALATGTKQIAEAYNAFTPEARLLKIMELLPAIIRELPPIMTAIAAPLGNIDRVTIVDAGGSGAPGQTLVKMGTMVPRILEDISKTMGVDLSGLFAKLQMKVGEPGVAGTAPTTTPAAARAGLIEATGQAATRK